MKIIFLILGFFCLGLGLIGIPLPILPTTPLLLAAAFCFAKGSKRINRWFVSTKLYQKHLDGFVKNRSMTLKTKLTILLPVSAMMIFSLIMINNLHVRILLAVLILVKYYYFFFRIKTVPREDPNAVSKDDRQRNKVSSEMEAE